MGFIPAKTADHTADQRCINRASMPFNEDFHGQGGDKPRRYEGCSFTAAYGQFTDLERFKCLQYSCHFKLDTRG